MLRIFEQIRADQAIANRTEEGWIEIQSAVIARAGVLDYQRGDGSVFREFRDPEVIHSADALNSYEGRPVLLGSHPIDSSGNLTLVNGDNSKGLPIVGSLRNVRAGQTTDESGDTHNVTFADVLIWHKDGILAAEKGIRQFSTGYKTKVSMESGEYNGENYDARQLEDIGNHVVLTPNARAGNITEFRLDSFDAVFSKESTYKKPETPQIQRGDMEFKIGDITGEISDNLLEPLEALVAERDMLKNENEELRASMQAMEQSSNDRGDAIRSEVQELVKLVESATRLCGSSYDWSNKTAHQLRADTISAAIPGLSLDGFSEEEIKGAYLVALRSKREPTPRPDTANATRGDGSNGSKDIRKKVNSWYETKEIN